MRRPQLPAAASPPPAASHPLLDRSLPPPAPARRRPFCSPLNSLRFDLSLATNMLGKAQAQMTADSLGALV